MKSGAGFLLNLGLTVAGAGLFAYGLNERAADRECRGWPRVRGEIVRVERPGDGGRLAPPPREPVTLTLRISVSGQEREVRGSLDEAEARGGRSGWKPGRPADWCYPPGRPEQGRLAPVRTAGPRMRIILGALVALAGLVRAAIGLVGKEVGERA